MKTARQFWREIFSENGIGSSKRLVGSVSMLVVLGCIIYLTIKDGGTSVVEGLLQVLMITSCSLLGLSTVTNIWKGGKTSINSNKEKEENENEE